MRPHRLNDGFNFICGQPIRLPYPADGYFLLVQHGRRNRPNAEFRQYKNRRREFAASWSNADLQTSVPPVWANGIFFSYTMPGSCPCHHNRLSHAVFGFFTPAGICDGNLLIFGYFANDDASIFFCGLWSFHRMNVVGHGYLLPDYRFVTSPERKASR